MEHQLQKSYQPEDRTFSAGGSQGGSNEPGSANDPIKRGKEAISSAASVAASSATSDLQSLRNDLDGLKDTISKFVSIAGNEAMKSARDVASNVTARVGTTAGTFADTGSDMASAATQQAKTFALELERLARRNPIGALAGAAVIGILIGMFGRRK
jgi:ElaB/YqjD/DUF883 family membrane-anchored ribosome-binding protein